ncbi:hypothetical protein L1D34_10325 [Vibrio mediterranei]|uniref:hypothetical protein n=1 Tax=Vibrio mediterranei TaxID=689 RepID=UPI001EFDAC8E|nr:hypothetical protein [Vibrio mediterranei]MCG9625237.1 hypothetical protein [Vibrio mediterranei]
MNFNLIQGQVMPLTVESSWLFIESYHGKLSVRIDSTGEEFTLPSGSVLRYGKPLGRILLSGQGVLSIEHGTGDFTPPIEGQKLDIQTMPKMELENGQSISVETMPKVEIANGQQVVVSELPKVRIENGQSVSVTSLPKVQIEAGQRIKVETLPRVQLAANQSIHVKSGSAITTHAGEVPLSVPANQNDSKRESSGCVGACTVRSGRGDSGRARRVIHLHLIRCHHVSLVRFYYHCFHHVSGAKGLEITA